MEKQTNLILQPWDNPIQKDTDFLNEEESSEGETLPSVLTDQTAFVPQAPHRSQKRSAIRILTEKANSAMLLLRTLIMEHRWQEVLSNQKIQSKDIAYIGVERENGHYDLARKCFINKVPGMTDMGEKKVMATIMELNQKYESQASREYLPRSFQWPEEQEALMKHIGKGSNRFYIAKPSGGGQGEGIQLIRREKDLEKLRKEAVVQHYIANPLILKKKKFDLRLYVLVSSVFPFIAYLNEEGLARFCTEDYEKPSAQNINNHYMHLTNYSLNKMSDNYIHSEETQEIHDGSKMTMCSLWKLFRQEGYSEEQRQEIMDSIVELTTDLMTSMAPFIRQSFREEFSLMTHQTEQTKKLNKCFHLLGVDVLVDTNLKAWLLEINANASFQVEYEGLSKDPADKKNKNIFSPIDYYVKGRVMADAVRLVRKKVGDQMDIGQGGIYNSYTQLCVLDEQHDNIFSQCAIVYEKLKGSVYKQYLTSTKFRRLGDVPKMTTNSFLKNLYELHFQKVMKDKQDFRNMDFMGFIECMEVLQTRLSENFSDLGSLMGYLVGTLK